MCFIFLANPEIELAKKLSQKEVSSNAPQKNIIGMGQMGGIQTSTGFSQKINDFENAPDHDR